MFEKAFNTSHLGELLRFAGCGMCLQADTSFFLPTEKSTKSPSHYILERRKPETAYWFNSIYMKFLNVTLYPWSDAGKCMYVYASWEQAHRILINKLSLIHI